MVFKKQRYFSVYEYPKEHVDVSPTRSEPKLDWNVASTKSNYFDADRIGYQELREEFNGRCFWMFVLQNFNLLFPDGFTVSSTARPFHGSQFNAMCHTWPTDADFSWSQVEVRFPCIFSLILTLKPYCSRMMKYITQIQYQTSNGTSKMIRNQSKLQKMNRNGQTVVLGNL